MSLSCISRLGWRIRDWDWRGGGNGNIPDRSLRGAKAQRGGDGSQRCGTGSYSVTDPGGEGASLF